MSYYDPNPAFEQKDSEPVAESFKLRLPPLRGSRLQSKNALEPEQDTKRRQLALENYRRKMTKNNKDKIELVYQSVTRGDFNKVVPNALSPAGLQRYLETEQDPTHRFREDKQTSTTATLQIICGSEIRPRSNQQDGRPHLIPYADRPSNCTTANPVENSRIKAKCTFNTAQPETPRRGIYRGTYYFDTKGRFGREGQVYALLYKNEAISPRDEGAYRVRHRELHTSFGGYVRDIYEDISVPETEIDQMILAEEKENADAKSEGRSPETVYQLVRVTLREIAIVKENEDYDFTGVLEEVMTQMYPADFERDTIHNNLVRIGKYCGDDGKFTLKLSFHASD